MGRAAWKGSVRATVALQAHRSEVLLYHGSTTLWNDYVSSGALSICNNGNLEASVQVYRRILTNR